MAFRTSTLPSWNAKENNAYFPTAKPVSEPSTTTGAKSASLPTNRYAYRKAHAIPGARCLSADNKTAYKKVSYGASYLIVHMSSILDGTETIISVLIVLTAERFKTEEGRD